MREFYILVNEYPWTTVLLYIALLIFVIIVLDYLPALVKSFRK